MSWDEISGGETATTDYVTQGRDDDQSGSQGLDDVLDIHYVLHGSGGYDGLTAVFDPTHVG